MSHVQDVLRRLGVERVNSGAGYGEWVIDCSGGELISLNPATGQELARVEKASEEEYDEVVYRASEAFLEWRLFPAPKRGEIVRQIADELRKHKDDLGALVTLEMGKIYAEGKGEVQEMIDMADLATGLSRQLYGLTMHSERPGHRMYEQWHPLGPTGVITAFNFPVAVWAWNAMVAAVCGNCVVWKPSPETPLTAIAVQKICDRVMERNGWSAVFNVVIGDVPVVGERMLGDPRLPLISATGSTAMGYRVQDVVGSRMGRTLLELGGNNGVIVMKDANLDVALRATLFGAVGTAGQRCTTIRRLFVQEEIAERFTNTLVEAYKQVPIGDPMDTGTLMGPLINRAAVDSMMNGLDFIREQGGRIAYGGNPIRRNGGFFVEPTIVQAESPLPVMKQEIFAPILYIVPFDTLDRAIEWHNAVPQGLSSAIFTNDLIAAETFLSARGSDCGIANVNIGTSGAEIGGAFGGEKETGGGREAGSDSWKAYMRRQTVTANWSNELPLAQGIKFQL